MKNKLFVISIDAMVREDVPYMETKPNFSRLMKDRAEVTRVTTVYPALTYPAHASIMTGCRPGKHGIIHNSPMKTVEDGITHFYRHTKNVKTEDVFAAAKRAGCSTAAVFWPITAFNPNIDHNINENFLFYPGELEHAEEVYARDGSDEAALRAVRENLHRLPTDRGAWKIDKASTMDDFLTGCTCSLIRNEKPDFLMVHNCIVDSCRHRYGAFGEGVKDGLDLMDEWLGEIMQAMEDAGVFEDTDFVILSDHGQMDFSQWLNMNALLARGGFVDIAPDGSIYDWQAWGKSNGFSTAIHLVPGADEKLRQQVCEYLLQLKENPDYGIEKVRTMEETKERYGIYGPFDFMLESDGRTAFTDKWIEPALYPRPAGDRYLGKHGNEPEKGPQPVFMARGPRFQPGAVIPHAEVIDEAPTLAHLLGQKMPQAEGRVLTELLRV